MAAAVREKTMKTLKVLSALLCYPRPEMIAALDDMAAVIEGERLLPPQVRKRIQALVAEFRITDLYVLQEEYVNLFDRGRAVSLHLFEHVHGESRDRGQAMVDLIDLYRANGFELSARELPDYLPMLLEYLSERPMGEAQALLGDAMPVIVLVGERLALRESRYHVIFDALQVFAGAPENLSEIREQAANEGPDETVVNMDKFWEEEAVTFLAPGGCGSEQAGEQPIHWVKPERAGTVPAKHSVFGG
jgi:nitrate reductase molybdenum cofactor assembly chaperone NarJ/NarW